MGDKPKYKIIRKNAEGKWDIIGAGWDSDKGDYSLSIEPKRGGEKIKCIIIMDATMV